jgi:hypothetical protein
MLRAGDGYYAQLKRIDACHQTQQKKQGPAKRSSLQGAWFMEQEHVATTDEHWRGHYVIRVLMIINMVHQCLLSVVALRKSFGLGLSSGIID